MMDLPMKIAATGALFAVAALLVATAYSNQSEPPMAIKLAVAVALCGGLGALFAGTLAGIWT